MVQTARRQNMTIEMFLELPETKPASEFIDGAIAQKPMPQGRHSIIQRELTFFLDRPLKASKTARAFPELRCSFGARSIVPDISVVGWERIPREEDGRVANAFAFAPDWTIEILSPDQNQTKVVKNITHCLTHSAQLGWLIDPEEETVFVYRSPQEFAIFDGPEDLLPMPRFVPLALTVAELFGWLSE